MAADEGSDLERYSESYCWELLQDIEHGGAADLSPEELKDFRILNAELEKQASQQRYLAVGPGPLGQLVEREPIGKEELAYVNARAQRCADHLNSFCQLDPPLDTAHAPRIGVAASGGGYRAMLGTVGFVNSAQQIGLYDGITYIAGLSGSTWAISTAYDKLQKGEEPWDKGPWMESVATHLLSSLTEGAYLRAALRAILHAKKQGRRFNLVDLYGLLFHMKFGSGKSKPAAWVTLDELRVGLDASNPTVPYPICTCITQEGDRWVEMTPHRIGFSREKFFIPTRNFGMKFERGKSVSGENEPLYFLEGIWGSAFAANYAAALAYLPKMKSGVAKAVLRLALKATLKATAPLRVARVPNFVKGTEFAELAQAERISVLDAGGGTPPTSFNLALPPLVEIPEREVDIIIVLEMSEGCSKPDGDAELWKSSQYFNGQRFPAGLTNPLPPQPGDLPFRVLKPQDQGPWIFYLPIRCKPEYLDLDTDLDTLKFEYTAEIVNRYWTLVNDLLVASSEGLKATIREKWQEKIAAAAV